MEMDEDLLEVLKKNIRLRWNPEEETLEYMTRFVVRNKEELLMLLQDEKHIPYEDIMESYPDVGQDLANLEKEGEILALVFEPRDKESKRSIYFRDASILPPIHSKLVNFFNKKTVLNPQLQIGNELRKRGLDEVKLRDITSKHATAVEEARMKKKKRKKNIRISNKHLGIDMRAMVQEDSD